MSIFYRLFLMLLLISPLVINATEKPIKVGDTFNNLKTKFGMPDNVSFLSNSAGDKFETIHFKSHKTAYVFNASTASSMNLQPNASFKVCRIIQNPEKNVSYTCQLD